MTLYRVMKATPNTSASLVRITGLKGTTCSHIRWRGMQTKFQDRATTIDTTASGGILHNEKYTQLVQTRSTCHHPIYFLLERFEGATNFRMQIICMSMCV